MANPTYVGAGAFVANHTSANRVARPTVATGDLMLAVIGIAYSDADVTPPAGWTLVAEVDLENVFRSGAHVYRKTAAGGEAADYLFTISGQGGGNNIGSAQVFAWSGVHATTPIDVSATTAYAASSTSIVCPSVTTTVADTTLVCVAVSGDLQNVTYTAPSGMTERGDNRGAGGESIGVFSQDLGAAGSTGTKTATASSATTYHAITIAIAPAAGGGATGLRKIIQQLGGG